MGVIWKRDDYPTFQKEKLRLRESKLPDSCVMSMPWGWVPKSRAGALSASTVSPRHNWNVGSDNSGDHC